MTDGLKFKGDNNYLEVVGLNSYCFENPFVPEFSNFIDEYIFSISIGRIANKNLFSIGFSEEYVSGKHYDILVGFGFGLFGFLSVGKLSSLDSSCKVVSNNNAVLSNNILVDDKYSFIPGDCLEFKFNFKEYKCVVSKNQLFLFDVYLPKVPLFFCISNGCYTGISSVKVKYD
jgi:hypothetical protein